MEKVIQIFSESQLDAKTLEEIRNQEFVGKKKAKISGKSVVISIVISLLCISIITFAILFVRLIYNPTIIYEKFEVDTDEVTLTKLAMEETQIEIVNRIDIPQISSGNSTGEYAEDDLFYYIPLSADGCCIYRISKEDFSIKKISDIPGKHLNLLDGILYFVNTYDNSNYEHGVYRVDLSSSEGEEHAELIYKKEISDMVVQNGCIYYIDSTNSSFYMLNVKEDKEYIIDSKNYTSMSVFGGRIYLIRKVGEVYELCYLSDIEMVKTIDETSDGVYFVSEDGVFLSKEDGIHILKNSSAMDYETERIINIQNMGKINVHENKIYFIDRSMGNKIGIYNLENGKLQHFSLANVTRFELLDELILIHYKKYKASAELITVNDIYGSNTRLKLKGTSLSATISR